MGVYVRPDSPFFWLLLERPGQRAIREPTDIPKDGGNPYVNKTLRQHAQEVYAQRMIDLSRRRHRLPAVLEGRTVRQHRLWYAQHVSAHKRGTTRERSILKQLGSFFDSYELAAVDADLVREWRTARLHEVSVATVRREEAVLKHLLSTAVPKYLEHHPLAGFKNLRVPGTDTRILTPDEEQRLLAALTPGEDAALVLCALDTLLRLSNVRLLTRQQDHGTHLFSDTKTTAIKIPVSARLRRALDQVPHAGPRYFPSYDGDTNNAVVRMFVEACRRAEIPLGRKTGGISFHCLRHTGASRMLAAGVDVKTVMEIGGWKNLRVLER